MRAVPFTPLLIAALFVPAPTDAQLLLDRGRLLDGSWVGQPWTLELRPSIRFVEAEAGRGLREHTTFDVGLGLPGWLMAGARYSPRSPVVPGRPDEWEAFGRWAALHAGRAHPLDLSLQAGWNGAAGSADAEVLAARWFGAVRLQAAGRWFSDAWGSGEGRAAGAAGVVVMPSPRGLPLSMSADVAAPFDRAAGERAAWSVALNLGIAFTTHSVSAFVTNSASSTLQGTTRGDDRRRIGLAFSAPIPVGQLLGLVVPRERAMESVQTEADVTPGMFAADIERYAFVENRIVVERGTTIEWTNRDRVVHTVDADDGSWGSGAIQPDASWRARFDEPGIYPYHCGPHPFMKGVVIVR